MAATKRDLSGVFDAELRSDRTHRVARLDRVFHLSHKGITFVSEKHLPEWTEVGVEMRMPGKGARKGQQVSCRGAVVQCTRRGHGRGFAVALVFLDLPKRAQSQLDLPAAAHQIMSICIAR